MTAHATAPKPRKRASATRPDSEPVPSMESRQNANGALREAVLRLLEATSRAANTPEVQRLRDEVRRLCWQR
jgi:hypothetical protein